MQGPSFSSDKIQLHCPTRWSDMTQEQLRYTLELIGSGLYTSEEIRTMMLIRFCGIKVLKRYKGIWVCSIKTEKGKKIKFDLQTWQVQDMIGQLQFVDKPEEMDVRLENIHGFQAVDKLLHGLLFIDYLNLEVCYQGWVNTKSEERVAAMARILYRDENGNMPDSLELDIAETTSTLFWMFYIKTAFARHFKNFFKPVTEVGGSYNIGEAINAQVRALTDGDVTKEDHVKHLDCWVCLTELNAKAREAEEFNKKYGK